VVKEKRSKLQKKHWTPAEKRSGLLERAKQIRLAEERGERHIGVNQNLGVSDP